MDETTIPPNFASVISDFTKDLAITYPEYNNLWKDTFSSLTESNVQSVFDHCKTVYPERFFDILYQNDDIFSAESETNVHFLPNVDFKQLYNADGVSDNTKKTVWKYLQLVLFTVIGAVKDKNGFGETMNIFDGVDQSELHEKLSETMSGLTDFFKNMEETAEGQEEGAADNKSEKTEAEKEAFKNMFENMPNTDEFKKNFSFDKMEGMPNMENIQDHLNTLFNGKIGSLAKEMAEEISGDFADLIGEDGNDENPQDVIKKLMKNPKKIMDLMKTVGGKLDSKMKSGEISREEIMKEAGDLIGKMKDMGGNDDLNNMFKKMAKGMGGLGGLAGLAGGAGGGLGGLAGLAGLAGGAGGGLGDLAGLAGAMGGLGKNVRLDTNAIDRMTKSQKLKEKSKQRFDMKQLQQQVEQQAAQLKQAEREKAYMEEQRRLAEQYSILKDSDKDKYTFRINGEEKQEKSFIHPDLVKLMEEEDKQKQVKAAQKKTKKKKSKK